MQLPLPEEGRTQQRCSSFHFLCLHNSWKQWQRTGKNQMQLHVIINPTSLIKQRWFSLEAIGGSCLFNSLEVTPTSESVRRRTPARLSKFTPNTNTGSELWWSSQHLHIFNEQRLLHNQDKLLCQLKWRSLANLTATISYLNLRHTILNHHNYNWKVLPFHTSTLHFFMHIK